MYDMREMTGDGAGFEAEEWPDERVDLGYALREALGDEYQDASPEDIDEALSNVLGSMSAAEAFNFATALQQIGAGAQKALADPTVAQVLRTALPIAGGAVGTVIGGPVGTALGTSLGTAAVGALPGAPPRRPSTPAPAAGPAAPFAPAAPAPARATPVAGGSAAAAQGLVLTQQPDVLKALLALAMGQHGQRSVNGVPVAQILGMLSSVVGQAAADADELMYLDEAGGEDDEAAPFDDSADDRMLYTTLLDADNYELAEAVGRP